MPDAAAEPNPQREAERSQLVALVTLLLDAADVRDLADLALDAEDYELAHRLLDALRSHRPNDTDILSGISICLLETDRWPEARHILEQAATFDTTGCADVELAWAALQHGDCTLAKIALLRALERDPKHLHEIHHDGPTWAPIRYDPAVMRAIEHAQARCPRERKEATHTQRKQP